MQKIIIPHLMMCSLISGCMATSALPEQQRPEWWAQSLSRAHNFYQVDAQVFRSEQPSQSLLLLLRQQQIDVIINLRHSQQDIKILTGQGRELVHIPMHTWAIKREDLLQVMRSIQQARQQHKKVLIHCYHGSDRTGASVAMYRIVFQGWPIKEAIREMKHGNYGYHAIWINIEKLFTPENIKWIQQQLLNPSTL